jgi:hypothetical protein
MIILLVIVAAAVCAPLAAVVLVSLGSRREDSAHSLAGGPSGALEAAARRLVGFHGDGVARKSSRRGAAGAHRGAGRAHRVASGYLDDQPEVPHLVA